MWICTKHIPKYYNYIELNENSKIIFSALKHEHDNNDKNLLFISLNTQQ